MKVQVRQRFGLAVWLLVLICSIGCAGDDGSAPPTIRFGEEACAHCRMIISDDRFAAALTTADGEVLKFDEIGCLLQYRAAHADPVRSYWVSDYLASTWLNAEKAVFVQSDRLVTPMASGIVALPTADQARQVAEPIGGRISRFDELAAQETKIENDR